MAEIQVFEVPFKMVKPDDFDYDSVRYEQSFKWSDSDHKSITAAIDKILNTTSSDSQQKVKTSNGIVTITSEKHPQYSRRKFIRGYIEQKSVDAAKGISSTKSELSSELPPQTTECEKEDSSIVTHVEDSAIALNEKVNSKLNNYEVTLKNGRVITFSAFEYKQWSDKYIFLDKTDPPESFVLVSEVAAINKQ